eukprot:scaffold2879_cov269-Prasinococcus_capsulatus_cf.AAC.4
MVSEKTYLMPVVLLGAIEGPGEAGLVAFGGCSAHGSQQPQDETAAQPSPCTAAHGGTVHGGLEMSSASSQEACNPHRASHWWPSREWVPAWWTLAAAPNIDTHLLAATVVLSKEQMRGSGGGAARRASAVTSTARPRRWGRRLPCSR